MVHILTSTARLYLSCVNYQKLYYPNCNWSS